MSIGKQNKRTNLQAYSLKVKTKDLERPAFEVSKREGDKYVKLPEFEYEVGGNLIGVEPKEFVYNNSPVRNFQITLQDGEEIYFISVPFSGLGRGLANSLLSLADTGKFNDVAISLYMSKPKKEGAKGFPSAGLTQDGEMVRWKFDMSQLPKPDEVTFKGVVQRDWTKTELFFSEQLKELNKIIKNKVPAQVTSTSETGPVDGTKEVSDDDLPF